MGTGLKPGVKELAEPLLIARRRREMGFLRNTRNFSLSEMCPAKCAFSANVLARL
jgi:hypothetical protein